ncbi:MAG: hypothetical protein ACETVW_02830 [Dehalococcoidia bacterium]
MIKLPLLDFRCHGQVEQDKIREIQGVVAECYTRLGGWLPERVEVHLFDTPAGLAGFLEGEKKELGIKTGGDEAFICSHDAWRGFPRLLICIERLSALSPVARLGALRHEVAHTVLHGALAYYVFRIPRDCLELAKAKDMDSAMLQQVLYYCATAVKDFEATRLLLSRGYQECQVAYTEAQFAPSDEDEFAWFLAKHHPQARLLFFTSQLKTLLPGWPLEVAGLMRLEECADSMLSYMELDERKRLVAEAISIAKQLGEDTHNNVRLTLGQVLQELI